ncbi:hypothetical protein [Streptomyces sp. NPDC059916]|uniref:hypothetical protein n=1 Tax=Streptomyces sp. NPDC059916 TaxID=3347001 RepID=UPI0036C91532
MTFRAVAADCAYGDQDRLPQATRRGGAAVNGVRRCPSDMTGAGWVVVRTDLAG